MSLTDPRYASDASLHSSLMSSFKTMSLKTKIFFLQLVQNDQTY